MAVIGGPIESVSINGRTFAVPQDVDASIVLGGDQNSVEPNGDGATARILKEIVPFKVSGLGVVIDDDAGDHQFLQDIIDGSDFVDVTLTMADGKVYYGKGIIVEEAGRSSKTSSMEISISGPGRMTKQ